MSRLILKIVYRFMVGVVALSAGLAFVAVFLVFTQGAVILNDPKFVFSMKIYLFFIPFVSGIFVIPNTIREHREGNGREKSIFEEPN